MLYFKASQFKFKKRRGTNLINNWKIEAGNINKIMTAPHEFTFGYSSTTLEFFFRSRWRKREREKNFKIANYIRQREKRRWYPFHCISIHILFIYLSAWAFFGGIFIFVFFSRRKPKVHSGFPANSLLVLVVRCPRINVWFRRVPFPRGDGQLGGYVKINVRVCGVSIV